MQDLYHQPYVSETLGSGCAWRLDSVLRLRFDKEKLPVIGVGPSLEYFERMFLQWSWWVAQNSRPKP